MTAPATADILLRVEDKRLKPELDQAKQAINSFSTAAKASLAVVAVGLAALAAYNVGKQFLELYGIQEQAEAKLQAVLKATGYAAGFSADQLKARAAELQNMTTVGDEAIINAQAVLATFKEVRGPQFDRAIQSALDLSAVLDGDLKGATLQLGKALNDPVAGMTALTRSGVSFTQQQKEQIRVLQESGDIVAAQTVILDELASQFGGAAAAKADTFTGKLQQMSNRWGDVKEKGGELLATVLTPFIPIVEGCISIIEAFIPAATSMASTTASVTKYFLDFLPSITYVTEAIDIMTVATTVSINEWRTVLALGLTQAQASIVGFAEDVWYFFTEIIPVAIGNTGEIFYQVFTRMDEFLVKVTKNILTNVVDFAEALGQAFLGKGFNFQPTSLLQDFKLELDTLPAFADRKLSDLEKQLQRDIEGYNKALGKAIDDAANKTKEVEGPPEPPPRAGTEDKTKEDKAKEDKAKGNDTATGGTEGLLALYSRITGAAAKPLDISASKLSTAAENLQAAASALQATPPAVNVAAPNVTSVANVPTPVVNVAGPNVLPISGPTVSTGPTVVTPPGVSVDVQPAPVDTVRVDGLTEALLPLINSVEGSTAKLAGMQSEAIAQAVAPLSNAVKINTSEIVAAILQTSGLAARARRTTNDTLNTTATASAPIVNVDVRQAEVVKAVGESTRMIVDALIATKAPPLRLA